MKTFNKEDILEISKLMKDGSLIAFPTETVFGLGIISTKKEYFDRLCKVKDRKADKPFTLMASSLKQVEKYVEFNELSLKIFKSCFPNKLTLILKAKKDVPDFIDLKTGYVGVRIPDDKFLLELIDKIGEPLLVPSCNKRDQIPCRNDKEVSNIFDTEIDGVVKGDCKENVASTIIKIEDNNLVLVRQGTLTVKEIKEKAKL